MHSDFSMPDEWRELLATHADIAGSAEQVLCASDFVLQSGLRQPQLVNDLFEGKLVEQQLSAQQMDAQLAGMLTDVTDEQRLQRQLRRFRNQQMVRIIWRDLAGWSDLAETVADLSNMADACIRQALSILYTWQVELNGTPVNEQGEEQCLLVLGMGKLGAGELNLSSDIDLIFAYPEEGQTQGGKKQLYNEEFFTRLGRKLIQALDNKTADGFVFRVDMRLRPFGDSGPLVSSFDALEDYYQTQGREWERYAMIKARAITGTEQAKAQFTELLRPFVFRRYLDYGMFDSLREMKTMIAGQLHRKGMEDNIKLGAGGIREIEFIGQVFQLIYGGRDRPLQQRPILTILDLLGDRGMLSSFAVTDLKAAYEFLRRTEHRIQAWADQQTHVLPQDEPARQRLANSMGFTSWSDFAEKLAEHRQQVHEHFEQLLAQPQAEGDDQQNTVSIFNSSDEERLTYLTEWGYHNPEQALQTIDGLLAQHSCRNLTETGRHRLERLLPLLVQAAAGVEHPDECLSSLMPLLEAIMRRSAYMSLLVENPMALSQLVKLCAASQLISKQLARYPILLDELLDPRTLYQVPDRQTQQQALNEYLAAEDEDDLEQQMNRLREFRQIATLHVAAADITGVLPLMRVGDQLTELAEIQLEYVWKLAWKYLVNRHGYPPITENDDPAQCGFVILAYGKLGGLELGYGSDLDLVFIYDDEQQGVTSGDKPVDVMVFYTRLAQRMIHLLNTVTAGGMLYEVDTRLRPSGASGLLVSPLSGFADYQNNDAWTWEHQALVRARCVAGDTQLAEKVSNVRKQVLSEDRNTAELRSKVSEMRTKMRGQLDKSNEQVFDLKQGIGGITDIEFMVQYSVLAWSANLPELLVYTDNIRILDALVATGKLSQEEGEMLADAYRYYRNEANRCVLQDRAAQISVAQLADYPTKVTEIWQRWLGED